ncbi:MAG: diacylglycerol/polyprenol kinase family protein, partial [Acidobacteriota bacterium]
MRPAVFVCFSTLGRGIKPLVTMAARTRKLTLEEIEDRRQLEHVVPLFIAFLLPYVTYRGILMLGAFGLIYSLYVSPRWIQVTTRPEERNRVSIAKLSYTLASLSVLLCFHRRIYIGAGAFAVLAVGDALSNLAGRKIGGPRFPYNRRKTVVGFIAFSLGGTLAAWTVILWNRPAGADYPATQLLLFCALVASACALVETLPAVIDDNITIVWVAALLFWLLFSGEPGDNLSALLGGDGPFGALDFGESIQMNQQEP